MVYIAENYECAATAGNGNNNAVVIYICSIVQYSFRFEERHFSYARRCAILQYSNEITQLLSLSFVSLCDRSFDLCCMWSPKGSGDGSVL